MIWSKRIQITAEMATPIAAWRQNACRVPKKNAKPRKKSTTLIRNPPTAPHAVDDHTEGACDARCALSVPAIAARARRCREAPGEVPAEGEEEERYRDERDELRELAGALRVGRGQRVERDEDDEEDELERDLEPHSFSMAWNFSTLG